MKKFLYQILIFVVVFLMANLFVYNFVTYDLLIEDYQVSAQKMNEFDKFIFSDSHGWTITKGVPVSKKKLERENIYNFSYGGDSYVDILYKLNFLLRSNIRIDTLLISVDDHMLSSYREKWNNEERSIIYASSSLFLDYNPINRVQFIHEKYLNRYLPLLNPNNSQLLRKYLLSLILGSKEPEKNDEKQTWYKKSQTYRFNKSKKRADLQYPSDFASITLKKALKQIIEISKNKNIDIIGLKFPLSPTYRTITKTKGYSADKMLTQSGFKVLNFQKMFNRETYFSDQDHVNKRGSIIFVDSLISKLNNK